MPPTARRRASSARGSALILAVFIVALLAMVGVALVRIAGADRTHASSIARKDRGVLCAEAGLQYARRFFGSNYPTTHGWNDWLGNASLGFRYDPSLNDAHPTDFSTKPLQARGASDGVTLDAGADVDGDGQPDFWVSLRDDDDERPLGIPDNRTRDNNETIIIRSECTNPAFAITQGGVATNVVVEALLTNVQGSSGYGTAARTSNAPDLVGGR